MSERENLSLKIPKGQSEFVYRRTDNTMAKRKHIKGQTTILKTLHRKRVRRTQLKTWVEHRDSRRVSSSGSTSDIHRVTAKNSLKIRILITPIRIRISKKNRQHNGQKKKYRRTNNDQQNLHIKLKME